MSAYEDGRDGMPLRASVKDGTLTLSIGIRTLAFAFENSEDNNPFIDGRGENEGEYETQFFVSDPLKFAEDVCDELNREGEDGSTPLTRLLDSTMQEAVNQGSLGIVGKDL